MKKICVVYVTVNERKAADRITGVLIDKQLAASVNRVTGVESTYRWKGKVERTGELLLIIKTKASLLKAVIKEVKKLHPYEVPEIISMNVDGGSPEYIKWVNDVTIQGKA